MIARTKAQVKSKKDYIASLKEKPCADCGRQFPPWMMDFDHRDKSTKTCNPAVLLARGKRTPELIQELAKCDLVCALCHARRTHQK